MNFGKLLITFERKNLFREQLDFRREHFGSNFLIYCKLIFIKSARCLKGSLFVSVCRSLRCLTITNRLDMSVIGKGRGRGFTDVRDVPLRRPGQLNTYKFDDLIDFIDNLFVEDIISGHKVDEIVQLLKNSSKNNSLKDIFDDLHRHALEDRHFGVKLAIACSDPKIYTLNDCNLRLVLLQTLQKDYEEQEQIRTKSIAQFRNAISLLGVVYYNLKINGKSMDILATPLLHYLESLLKNSEEEDIELLTIQVFINGSKIVEQSSPRSKDFLILVRQVLVNRNLSAKSRAMLLFIIDLSNQQFTPLVGKLREFYFKKADGNPFIDIKNHISYIVIDPSLVDDVSELHTFVKSEKKFNQCQVEKNIACKSTKALHEQVDLRFGTTDKSLLNTNCEKASVPRAIRGAGAGDSIKDENNGKLLLGKRDKVTDEQMRSSKQNTSSNIWGHDDRFDKDYTYT